jgi:lactate permease
MLAFICVIVLLQAYVFKWLIPDYQALTAATASAPDITRGYIYLSLLAVILVALASMILVVAKRKNDKQKTVNLSIIK